MIVPVYMCDLCKKEHRPNRDWYNNANGGAITVCRDGINGAKEWEHLCPSCRRTLVDAIEQAIDSIKNKP